MPRNMAAPYVPFGHPLAVGARWTGDHASVRRNDKVGLMSTPGPASVTIPINFLWHGIQNARAAPGKTSRENHIGLPKMLQAGHVHHVMTTAPETTAR